jgi:hypothetical protein
VSGLEVEIIASANGEEHLRRFLTAGEYVVGREDGVDVKVDVALVSRRPAKLSIGSPVFKMTDENFAHALELHESS